MAAAVVERPGADVEKKRPTGLSAGLFQRQLQGLKRQNIATLSKPGLASRGDAASRRVESSAAAATVTAGKADQNGVRAVSSGANPASAVVVDLSAVAAPTSSSAGGASSSQRSRAAKGLPVLNKGLARALAAVRRTQPMKALSALPVPRRPDAKGATGGVARAALRQRGNARVRNRGLAGRVRLATEPGLKRRRLDDAVRPAAYVTSENGVTVVKEEASAVEKRRNIGRTLVGVAARALAVRGRGQVRAKAEQVDDASPVRRATLRQVEVAAPAPARRQVRVENRSRKLFGRLLGHLTAAKEEYGDDGPSRLISVKREVVKRQSSDERKELEKVESESNDDNSEVEREKQRKEMKHLENRLQLHYENMNNFIRTRAEPTIFWIPAKHTQKTKEQLRSTQAAIKQKISSLAEHLQPEDQESAGGSSSAAEESDHGK